MTFFWPNLQWIDTTQLRDERSREVRVVQQEIVLPLSASIRIPFLIGTNDSTTGRDDVIVVPGTSTTDSVSRIPNPETTREAARLLSVVRDRTGLPWATVGRMLGVDRRTLYFWLEGRPISPENRRTLSSLASHVARLDRGSQSETRDVVLDTWAAPEATPAEDRLAELRVSESDAAAFMPRLSVATLLMRGDDALPPSTDPSRRKP